MWKTIVILDLLSKIQMVSKGLSNKEIRLRVLRVFSTLVTDVDADRLSDFLIEGLIITIDQWQEIQHKSLTKQGRCRELISMLMRMKNPVAFVVFMEALQRNPQWHWIVELILNQDSKEEEELDSGVIKEQSDRQYTEARMEWEKEREELLRKQRMLEKRIQEMEISETSSCHLSFKEQNGFGGNFDRVSTSETQGINEQDWVPMARNYSFKSLKSAESPSRWSSCTRLSLGRSIVCGKIQLQISYDEAKGRLEVNIVQCKGLAPAVKRQRRSDPYVKLYLMSDENKLSKRKTTVIRNDLNPFFMEKFLYNLSFSEVDTFTLWISVWHNVKFGRNKFLGEVAIPLDANHLSSAIDDWFFLEKPLHKIIR